ncbi:MAG TPA: J domain-containing protein, partial [Phenylobacterium sp.]|nr:J domain-containing protein [Phenylobacterium sp.]
MLDYYRVLEVDYDADGEAIRAAYRRLARRWHPDQNPDDGAVERFQRLTEAYGALSDSERRARYDAERSRSTRPPPREAVRKRPIVCSDCGRPTAQPRLRTFRSVASYVIWSRIDKHEGVFCSACAEAAGLRASGLAALAGWWAPFGPMLTVVCIGLNASGGTGTRQSDHRLALFNASAFLEGRNPALAFALARQVRAQSTGPAQLEAERIAGEAKALGLPRKLISLRDPWRPRPGALISHLVMAAGPPVAIATIFWLFWAAF